MSLADFRLAPWKNTHPAYGDSWLHMRPAPEFATAEVVLASTYRSVGFPGYPERVVPSKGREFDKLSARTPRRARSFLSVDAWKTVLHGALQSPKQPKQSARRFLQLCPVVPDAALYSNSARLTGNSWNPGELVQRMVITGTTEIGEAQSVWQSLFDGLSVQDDDDIWARWLEDEFVRRRDPSLGWTYVPLTGKPVFSGADFARLKIPSRQFVTDLLAVLSAKQCMTRRQWVSILESVLRVGAVAHVLWLCGVNARLSRSIGSILDGAPVPDIGDLERDVISAHETSLVYGMPALPIIRDIASRYLSARLHLNLLLWHLESNDVAVPSLDSVKGVHELLTCVSDARGRLSVPAIKAEFESLSDAYARDLACKRGIGSNIAEFCRYTLGQRQTADATLRGYDQGYGLRKKADYSSAPWVIALGPVALLAFSHCCLAEAAGPRSVGRLREHLAEYGIDVAQDDIAGQQLGRELRTLGLVLDSPDAESGMLLVPPFDTKNAIMRAGA